MMERQIEIKIKINPNPNVKGGGQECPPYTRMLLFF
jgi:hypothetical protein